MPGEVTSVVILGATGDLSRRKLVPGLFNLWCKGRLGEDVRVVGFARSRHSDESFRAAMWEGARSTGTLDAREEEWAGFAGRMHYVPGDLGAPGDFARLGRRLQELEGSRRPANRLFYLSIAPELYEATVRSLGDAGLAREESGWRRVVIEKPFGWDLESAQRLNREVHRVFPEERVYRIDHYLGKEAVQNLIVFRFANAIFEPLWNRNYVDAVEITGTETLDVAERAGYYDQSGVVRDMLQNHLLQLLTLVAMEPPSMVDADSLRNNKVDVLKAVRRWEPGRAGENAALGQYRGYGEAKGVAPGSTTPTYAAVRLFVDNWRWQGVPFYIRSGKALKEKVTEIVVHFRCPPTNMFSPCPPIGANALGLCLQPDEGAHLRFEAKVPGQGFETRGVDMEFHYRDALRGETLPEAYERLLEDALHGDPALFIRNDHIEEAWRIVDPLLRGREQGLLPVHPYAPGSWGPGAADELLTETGHAWVQMCGGHGR